MTRQDFNAIAKSVAETEIDWREREKLVNRLADHFATRNPLFDRRRFFQACLPPDPYEKGHKEV